MASKKSNRKKRKRKEKRRAEEAAVQQVKAHGEVETDVEGRESRDRGCA